MMDGLKKMSRSPRALGALLALLSIVTGHAAIAAGLSIPGLAAAATPADTAPKSAAPEPIAAGDIPMRADEDERFAQDALVRARKKDAGKKLGAELDAITAGIVNLSKASAKEDLKQLSVIRLESLESHWRFYDRELRTGGATSTVSPLLTLRTLRNSRSGAPCGRPRWLRFRGGRHVSAERSRERDHGPD